MRAGRRGEAWERAVLIRAVIKPCQEEEATPLSTSLTDTDGLLTRRRIQPTVTPQPITCTHGLSDMKYGKKKKNMVSCFVTEYL